MAISSNEKVRWKPLRSKLPYFDSSDLTKKRLLVDFKSLRPIARRAIQSLERRESYHPHTIKYIYFINITILDDILFRNFNFKNLLKEKGANID